MMLQPTEHQDHYYLHMLIHISKISAQLIQYSGIILNNEYVNSKEPGLM